jgi:hypothetical protein
VVCLPSIKDDLFAGEVDGSESAAAGEKGKAAKDKAEIKVVDNILCNKAAGDNNEFLRRLSRGHAM